MYLFGYKVGLDVGVKFVMMFFNIVDGIFVIGN